MTPVPSTTASTTRRPSSHAFTGNLPVVSEEDAPPAVAELYAHFRSHFQRPHVPGILQCFATHPPLLEHMISLAETMLFCDGALGREQKELLATFVSARNRCGYCADSHGFSLRAHGGSEEALEAALACDTASPALTPRQQRWLSFIARVSDASHTITRDDVDGLREQGWSDLEIAETIHLAALFASFNRVVNAFGLSSQNLLQDLGKGSSNGRSR